MTPITKLLFLSTLLIPATSFATEDACKAWFAKSKLKPATEDCVLDCSMLKTDMGTFMCPNDCENLCQHTNGEQDDQLKRVVYYSGLTTDEYALIAKHPEAALKVYEAKELATASVKKYFKRDVTDSESDAFRHFMWAGFIRNKLDRNLSTQFLNAHESASLPDDAGTQMDKSNNQIGMNQTELLEKSKTWSQDKLESRGLT